MRDTGVIGRATGNRLNGVKHREEGKKSGAVSGKGDSETTDDTLNLPACGKHLAELRG